MGITSSSEVSNLPKVSAVLKQDVNTLKSIIEQFISQGYAAIDISELFEKNSNNQDQFDRLFSSASSFFKNSEEIIRITDDKRAFENIGYLKIGDVREYIKLRTGDADSVWPKVPSTFREDFIRVFDFIKKIAWILFEAAGLSSIMNLA